jgi:hypothetical protein
MTGTMIFAVVTMVIGVIVVGGAIAYVVYNECKANRW